MTEAAEPFALLAIGGQEMSMIWTALAVAIVALLLLAWAIKPRRTRPSTADVTPMKATLERRIREGADFRL